MIIYKCTNVITEEVYIGQTKESLSTRRAKQNGGSNNRKDRNMAKVNLEEVTAVMDDLKDTKARYEYELKEVEKKIAAVELILQSELTKRKKTEMEYGIYSWGYVTKTTNRLNQKLLKEKHPKIHAACVQPSTSTSFQFKINGYKAKPVD